MRKAELIVLGIILLSFGIGFYFYPQMPDMVASHWNINGEVDDYMPKGWGTFLMPIVSIFMLLLFMVIPRIDPLKANIEKFRKYFDGFIILIVLFLFYIYILSISWSIGLRFDMGRLMTPAMGLLFYYCGILIENAKRNWFIGIRTPWTLSSDSVWEKTHKIGAKLFKASGVIALLGIAFPQHAFYFVIFPVLFSAIYTMLYSYLEYQKEAK